VNLGEFTSEQFGIPTVTRQPDGKTMIEFDVQVGDLTAWESIQIERRGDQILLSDRSDGPVAIPSRFLGIFIEELAQLAPEERSG